MDAEEYDKIYSDKELALRTFKLFKPHRRSMIIVISFTVLISFTSGLTPLFTSLIIQQIESDFNMTIFLYSIIILLLFNSLSWLFNFFIRRHSNRVVYRVCYKLRRDVNKRVLEQDLSFFDKFPTGKIVSRINSDGQKFGHSANLFMQSAASILIVIIVLIPMIMINIILTGIFLLTVPFIFLITLSFRKVARKRTLLGQRSLAQVNEFVQESMAGIQIAKTFRQEKKLYREFQKINKQSFSVNIRRALFMNIIFPSLSLLFWVVFASWLHFGGILVAEDSLSASELFLFFQSSIYIYEPIIQIASFWPQFQAGLSAGERIFALMDNPSLIKQEENFVFPEIKGKIEINKLYFEYAPQKPVFNGLNLTIQPGESIAIVGHTGAGKSTIAKLLLRLYEFQSGDILIDETSIRNLSLHDFRRKVGFIPQTPFLWADSIENNVKYGSPHASREEVMWALKQSGGTDWVDDLDLGLETLVMERGKLLSMGQRQLIAFARVFLQDPSILILDEATASVDPFTETLIQEAMEKLMRDRTSIIIAHRLVTVRHVDRIIVLDQGKIVEEGNHEQLMQKNGYYARLYNAYFRHQSFEFMEEFKV